MSFAVSEMSKAFQGGSTEDMKRLVKITRKMKECEGRVEMERIEEGKEVLEVYSDASFGNVGEGQSQIGYIVSLKDTRGRKCPILWKSVRAKRVAKSTIEAEALSLGEAAETAVYLKEIWKEITGNKEIPIIIRTDSRTLESALKSTSGVKSKRLRIEIAAMREMLERKEIENVEWVGTEQQVADILTKKGVNNKPIREYVFGKVD